MFTHFNERYDKFNGPLAALAGEGTEITQEQRNLIVDYFNLCAEEYLFYQEGYIHRRVWRSWCRGMAWYLKRHPFKDIWNEEIKTESFYGLTEEIIREGAALPFIQADAAPRRGLIQALSGRFPGIPLTAVGRTKSVTDEQIKDRTLYPS